MLAWMTVAGWQALTASSAYLVSTSIQGLIVLTHPTFTPKPWQTLLLFWSVTLFAVLINTVTSRALVRFEGMILVVHLFGFFAVLVPLIYLSDHRDASFVFTTFLNEGEWLTQTLYFFVGLPAAVYSLMGTLF